MAACFFLLKQFDDVLVRRLFVEKLLADMTFDRHDVWQSVVGIIWLEVV
jgi:hypothetical protein